MIGRVFSSVLGFFGRAGVIKYGVGGLVIATGAGLLFQWGKIGHLEAKVERCGAEKAALENTISDYKRDIADARAAIQRQNELVEQWQLEAENSRVLLQQARTQIDADNRRSAIEIARIQNLSGESCQDGIALIDRELGL